MDAWKTFEKNNLTIVLNILYIKEKEIYSLYISKHNSTREKQIILIVIPNEEQGKPLALSLCDCSEIQR